MRTKKFLSLLLSAAMAFSLLTATAFAAAPAEEENSFFDFLLGKKYTYLYAALTWDEYWANEKVYAAGNAAAGKAPVAAPGLSRQHLLAGHDLARLPDRLCGAAQVGRTLRGGGLQPGRAVPCRPAALAPAGGLSGRTDRHFAVVRSGLMDIDLVFKIAATGIIVAVLNQLLIRSGREDQAMMTTLAGLVVVLSILVKQISALFVTIKSLFAL